MLEQTNLKWNASEKCKTSLNAQLLGFCWNRDEFLDFFSWINFGKCFWISRNKNGFLYYFSIYYILLKLANLPLIATKLIGLLKTSDFWVFFETEFGFCYKIWLYLTMLNVAIFPQKATEIVKFLKTCKVCFVFKKRWICQKKNMISSKIAKGSKIEVQCVRKSKTSQNVQVLGFFWNWDGFLEFFFSNLKISKCSKLL